MATIIDHTFDKPLFDLEYVQQTFTEAYPGCPFTKILLLKDGVQDSEFVFESISEVTGLYLAARYDEFFKHIEENHVEVVNTKDEIGALLSRRQAANPEAYKQMIQFVLIP